MSKTDNVPDVLANNFYMPTPNVAPRAWSECVLHLKKTYNEHKSKPVPSLLKSRLSGPSVSWKIFKRLNEAISYADIHTKDCMVFAYEEKTPGNSGQRLFLVTHPQHMWLNHKSRPLKERCTYEVIREGVPCKLYFDLEFSKLYNLDKDGNKMTDIFIKCVIAALFEKFQLQFVTSDFLWLDASTTVKYSCHLILQMKRVVFENNIQAGYFVLMLLERIKDIIGCCSEADNLWPSSDELKQLYVKNADGRTICFCDDGVYTKNRNFRMYLSTKYGKGAPLVLSEHNQYVPETSAKHSDIDEMLFYDSLITYFRKDTNFTKLLVQEQKNLPTLIRKNASKSNAKTSGHSSPSPYPEVDSFVLSIAKDDLVTGFIRKWTYLESQDILYEIGNYRFCNNIGRHHKSNNIMIIVDMKNMQYYQKCYDPECRAQGYKSNAQSLPESIISLYNMPDDFFDGNCFSQLKSEQDNPSDSASDLISNRIEDQLDSTDSLFDVNFDSYPFTQLKNPSDGTNIIQKKELAACYEKSFDSQFLERNFSNDTSLDDLNMEDLESEFVISSTKNENSCSEDITAFAGNVCYTNVIKSHENYSTIQDISMEEELILVEAAAAIEAVFDVNLSEETIF